MTARNLEARITKLENHPRFRGGWAQLTDEQLDASIRQGILELIYPYKGDFGAMVMDLERSTDPEDHDLAIRLRWYAETYLAPDPE